VKGFYLLLNARALRTIWLWSIDSQGLNVRVPERFCVANNSWTYCAITNFHDHNSFWLSNKSLSWA